MIRLVVFLMGSMMSLQVLAIEPFACRNGAFPAYSGIGLAQISASEKERVYLRDDAKGCPAADKCLDKSYVVKGNTVLAMDGGEGWTCVWYFGKKQEFVGWIPSKNISPIEFARSFPVNNWIGRWEAYGDDYTEIKMAPEGKINVSGEARWYGGENAYGEQVVHEGAFEGLALPTENKVTIKEGDEEYNCVVNLTLIGSYLLVTDNSNCGGMNVRFYDVYRKKPQ